MRVPRLALTAVTRACWAHLAWTDMWLVLVLVLQAEMHHHQQQEQELSGRLLLLVA